MCKINNAVIFFTITLTIFVLDYVITCWELHNVTEEYNNYATPQMAYNLSVIVCAGNYSVSSSLLLDSMCAMDLYPSNDVISCCAGKHCVDSELPSMFCDTYSLQNNSISYNVSNTTVENYYKILEEIEFKLHFDTVKNRAIYYCMLVTACITVTVCLMWLMKCYANWRFERETHDRQYNIHNSPSTVVIIDNSITSQLDLPNSKIEEGECCICNVIKECYITACCASENNTFICHKCIEGWNIKLNKRKCFHCQQLFKLEKKEESK